MTDQSVSDQSTTDQSTPSRDAAPQAAAESSAPRWRPIASLDRRVLGVLGEKAKTTPDAYPMTLNALKTGCNQKSNRYPLMEVEIEDVEESLERLRALGAVAEVQGGARVNKYRHLLYEWLGVTKVEMAVMVELLLRGAQTEGELRGRAARMEPIADLAALRPVLASLKSKSLIVSLSPEGRGHALTHALYQPQELEKVRREYSPARSDDMASDESRGHSAGPTDAAELRSAAGSHDPALAGVVAAVESLREDVSRLQSELAQARKDLDELYSQRQ